MHLVADVDAADAIALMHRLTKRQAIGPSRCSKHGKGLLAVEAIDLIKAAGQVVFKATGWAVGVHRHRRSQAAQAIGLDPKILKQAEAVAAAVLLLHITDQGGDKHQLLAGDEVIKRLLTGPAPQLQRLP